MNMNLPNVHFPQNSVTLPPQTELKDYRITALLQQDEVGALYSAENMLLEQPVLLREFVPAHCAMLDAHQYTLCALPGMEAVLQSAYMDFLTLLRSYASVSHDILPSLISVFSGPTGTVYAVFSYKPGQSISEVYSAENVEESHLRPILENALDALSYLFKKGLLPTSLTPSAIDVNDSGAVQLSLCGNFRAVSAPFRSVVKSREYAPVEHIQGKDCGMSSVIYSLGAVFYTIITGRTPMDAAARIGKHDGFETLIGRKSLQNRFSDAFLYTIDKALSLWPEDRWSNCDDWLASLNARLMGGSIPLADGLRLNGGGPSLGKAGRMKGGLRLGSTVTANAASVVSQGITPVYAAAPAPVENAIVDEDKAKAARSALSEKGIEPEKYVSYLCRAAEFENVENLCLLLDAGVDVNEVSGWTTALIEAVRNGNTECARLLLEHGADVNVKGEYSSSPLETACANGHLECVKLLLDFGATDLGQAVMEVVGFAHGCGNPDILSLLLNKLRWSPELSEIGAMALHDAARHNHSECMKLLLDNNIAVDSPDEDGKTALMVVTAAGEMDAARLLLEYGAYVNASDNDGWTPLMHCVNYRNQRLGLAELLLAHDANVNVYTKDGEGALSFAIEHASVGMVRQLIEAGADVNHSHHGLFSDVYPLQDALAAEEAPAMLELLLENGADFSLCVNNLIHDACSRGRVDCLKILKNRGVDMKALDTEDAALVAGAANGHADCLRFLLEENLNLEYPRNNRRPLIWAASGFGATSVCKPHGYPECLKLLLLAGAKIDARSFGGRTALMAAAEINDLICIKLLLEAGADVSLKDEAGRTAMELTTDEKCRKALNGEAVSVSAAGFVDFDDLDEEGAAELLSEMGIDQDEYAEKLLDACSDGDVDMVHLLLLAGADPEGDGESYGHDSSFPIVAAISYSGDVAVVKLLLEYGIDIDGDIGHESPLYRAVCCKDFKMVRFLVSEGADINMCHGEGGPPALAAVESGNWGILQFLVACGAELEYGDKYGNTPLLSAARYGKTDMLSMLINAGADVNVCDRYGTHVLDFTTDSECINMLKEAGSSKGSLESMLNKLAIQKEQRDQ